MNTVLGISMAFALIFGPANGQPAPENSVLAAAAITQGISCVEKAAARCLYKCKCTYVKKRKVACRRSFFLNCRGRLCSPCLGRAKVKARKKCRVRGAVRKCYCTFKKIRQIP